MIYHCGCYNLLTVLCAAVGGDAIYLLGLSCSLTYFIFGCGIL